MRRYPRVVEIGMNPFPESGRPDTDAPSERQQG